MDVCQKNAKNTKYFLFFCFTGFGASNQDFECQFMQETKEEPASVEMHVNKTEESRRLA